MLSYYDLFYEHKQIQKPLIELGLFIVIGAFSVSVCPAIALVRSEVLRLKQSALIFLSGAIPQSLAYNSV